MTSRAGLVALLLISTAAFAHGQRPPRHALEVAIQQQLDVVVSHFRMTFPNLAMSVAWKDASNDVAVASGQVNGSNIGPHDTFLYGSGTKPFTATAVLRLIDAGRIKATDKVSDIIDPYMQKHGHPVLATYFSEAVNTATVLDLLRMASGIRDFEDSYDFDKWVLAPENSSKFWSNYPYDAMNFAASADNTKNGSALYCNPGNCTAYSSTGFEVAGLVLAAVLQPEAEWYNFNLAGALFDNPREYPTMMFPPVLRGPPNIPHNGPRLTLDRFLTVPGSSVSGSWENATIYEQNPSILGWTCGNMVSSTRDVAKFFFHLLDVDTAQSDPRPLLSNASRTEMTTFKTLTTGWGHGELAYGAGMMFLPYWGFNIKGHEGDTYGFLSTQGYAPTLKGAFSIVSNVDAAAPGGQYPYQIMLCYLLQIMSNFTGSNKTLGCKLTETAVTILI